MALQDPDSERRNLVVLSLAFIVYALAGGEFESDQIRLQVINMKFTQPKDALAVIAWSILFWFLFRYWQTRERSIMHVAREDASGFQYGTLFKIIKSMISIPDGLSDIKTIHVEPRHIKNLRFKVSQSEGGISSTDKSSIPSGKLQFAIVLILIYTNALIRKPGIIGQSFPYILFLAAFALNV